MKCRHPLDTQFQVVSGLIAFATGSLAIVLLSESHRNDGDLIIIICSTFIFGLNNILTFTQNVRWVKFKYSLQVNSISANNVIIPLIFQMIALWSTVYLFHKVNNTNYMSIISQKEKNVLTALQSLLIINFFISGITLGSSLIERPSTNNVTISDNQLEKTNVIYDEKFIPIKNSSQTLTPSLDLGHNITTIQEDNVLGPHSNLINKQVNLVGAQAIQSRYNSSHISHGSVVVHPLADTSKYLSNNESPNTKRRRQKILSKFKRFNKRFRKSNENIYKKELNSKNVLQLEPTAINKRGTIFSEISGFSKNLIPFVGSINDKESKAENTSHSLILDVNQQKDQQLENMNSLQLQDERNAIGRFDNVLLPPYLRANENIPSTPKLTHQFDNSPLLPPPLENQIFKTLSAASDNILDNFDLHTIPQAHDNELDSDEIPSSAHNYPSHISLEMWEENKDSFINKIDSRPKSLLLPVFTLDKSAKTPEFNLKKLETLQENEGSLPLAGLGIQTSTSFSFPSKTFDSSNSSDIGEEIIEGNNVDRKIPESFSMSDDNSITNDINLDTISALDEYLHDEEKHNSIDDTAMEESLNQNFSSSFIADNYTSYDIDTRHSPTKSVISVLSGSGSLGHKQSNSRLTNLLGHSRGNSLINQHFPSNVSAQSSPTKSIRRQKLSKKLSFSNISDTFTSNSINEVKGFGVKYSNSFSHKVNRSIDFSYIRSLQGNEQYSPSKFNISRSNTTKTYNEADLRRHSVAIDNRLDAPISIHMNSKSSFYKQGNKASEEIHVPPIVNVHEIREVSGASLESSNSDSTERYPDIVMSEYDREKWNALKNVHGIPQDILHNSN
ncbi:hypothetical protein RNJ44_04646 [Nakaseomyces bracarensis]|uniref:Uncharacterized protein n=1 Tax=Nakaseomyces bracarensis TaxID=273131 RepID=A0ABR4NVJ7_9SACH